jgi:hypothetical protein
VTELVAVERVRGFEVGRGGNDVALFIGGSVAVVVAAVAHVRSAGPRGARLVVAVRGPCATERIGGAVAVVVFPVVHAEDEVRLAVAVVVHGVAELGGQRMDGAAGVIAVACGE